MMRAHHRQQMGVESSHKPMRPSGVAPLGIEASVRCGAHMTKASSLRALHDRVEVRSHARGRLQCEIGVSAAARAWRNSRDAKCCRGSGHVPSLDLAQCLSQSTPTKPPETCIIPKRGKERGPSHRRDERVREIVRFLSRVHASVRPVQSSDRLSDSRANNGMGAGDSTSNSRGGACDLGPE